jgi:two-component sensor histidine kinase
VTLGQQVASVLSYKGEEQRRARELTALYAVSAAMNQALSEEEALSRALERVLEVLQLESGRIYLLDPRTAQLTLASAQGNPALLDVDEPAISPGDCLRGLATQTGELHQTADLMSDPRVSRGHATCRNIAGYVCAAVPLPAKDRTLGVLHVASRRETEFSDADMALLRSIGAQIGVAVENMRLREEARRAEALSTLIQEMHHRIKNNLQTVADLLSLEMSASPSPAARKSLRDSISRIKSIAAVHELLSLEQLRLTDITELARQVCDISLGHLVRPDQHVTAEIAGPPIFLPSKQATALALVMNELIANALEHAFSLSRRDGRLTITIAQEGAQVTVTIADNGRGLQPDFDLDRTHGLGLRIARTLAEKDLAGTLRLENCPEGGTRATLVFYR